MCGMVGYIGPREATSLVFDGPKRLEYRGYDLAGMATIQNGGITIRRDEGKLSIPRTHPLITARMAVLSLQLLAYHLAVRRGCNVDQLRNLAKSVTVE
jgi:glucosamine 6-phosphate synthetase-like amidotransferase/phosphosugar isomerase protein